MDNGSVDRAWDIIQEASTADPRIRGFRMSRTFSLYAAFTFGLDNATTDIAIIMTSDLQDPPEAIPLLLRKYEEGDQILVKITKRDSVALVRRVLSKAFCSIAKEMTVGMLPESVSNFRLVSRRTYEAIRPPRRKPSISPRFGRSGGF